MRTRFESIPGFNIDRVAAAAGDDPDVLRLENLDTDLPPPSAAIEATRAAVGLDDANSWLPFTGLPELREAVADYVERRSGVAYDPAGSSSRVARATRCSTRSSSSPTPATRSCSPIRLCGDAEPRPSGGCGSAARSPSRRRRRMEARPRRAPCGSRPAHARALPHEPRVPDRASAVGRGVGGRGAVCRERDCALLYWSSFEGIVFDGRPIRIRWHSTGCASGR